METHKVFGNNAHLNEEFRQAFNNIKYYYPDFHPPKIQTIISGLETGCDMFVSDTLIVVGLDFFLGKGARYRPNMYEYMLRDTNQTMLYRQYFFFTESTLTSIKQSLATKVYWRI